MKGTRRLRLDKNDQVWLLDYRHGDEAAVVETLVSWAEDDGLDFTWEDLLELHGSLLRHVRSHADTGDRATGA